MAIRIRPRPRKDVMAFRERQIAHPDEPAPVHRQMRRLDGDRHMLGAALERRSGGLAQRKPQDPPSWSQYWNQQTMRPVSVCSS